MEQEIIYSKAFEKSKFQTCPNGQVFLFKKNSPTDTNHWFVTTLKANGTNRQHLAVFSFNGSNANGRLTFVSSYELPLNYRLVSIKGAPNENKLFVYATVSHDALVVDFNKTNGNINSPVTLNIGQNIWSSTFSPDSKSLYVIGNQKHLYQFNLNSTSINQSRVLVHSDKGFIEQMQIGPDNKIYVGGFISRLGVIHSPNQLCTPGNYNACNLDMNGPKKAISAINPTSLMGPGLPNMIDATQENAYPGTNTSISAYVTGCYTYKFFPDHTGTAFNWNFGDTASGTANTSTLANPSHTFTVGNLPLYTFTVTLRNSSNQILATKVITIQNTAATYTIQGTSQVCEQSENPISNSFVDLQNSESIQWTITSGTGNIQGPSN